MPLETAQTAIRMLFASPAPCVTIRFFGGEPLLNFPLIIEAVHFAKQQSQRIGKQVSFNLFTNGFLLEPEHLQFLQAHEFTVYLSIGGSEISHNQLRPLKGGGPSFQQVVQNAQRILAALPYRVAARVIVDPRETDPSLTKIVESLIDSAGFPFVSLDVPWMASEADFVLDSQSTANMKEQFSELAETMLKRFLCRNLDWAGIHQFGGVLNRLLDEESSLDIYSCGAGSEMLAVSTDGFLYPCHGFVGIDRFALGSVSAGITSPSELHNTFLNYSAETISTCKACWARFLCTKRCPFDAYLFNGDILKPNHFRCDLERHIIEQGLYLYATLEREAPRVFRTLKWFNERRKRKVGVW